MSEELIINASALQQILAINNAIQNRNARLLLNDKEIICVALDGTCSFDGYEENDIKLTNAQLNELVDQALQSEMKRMMNLLGDEQFRQEYMGKFIEGELCKE